MTTTITAATTARGTASGPTHVDAARAADETRCASRVEIQVRPTGRRGRGRRAGGAAVLLTASVVVTLALPMSLASHSLGSSAAGFSRVVDTAGPGRHRAVDVSARLVALLPGGLTRSDVIPAGPLAGTPTVGTAGHTIGHDVGSGSVTYGSGAPMVVSVVVRRVTATQGCAAPACHQRTDGARVTVAAPDHRDVTPGLVADLPGGYEVRVTQARAGHAGTPRAHDVRALTAGELESVATSTTWRG